MSRPPLVSRREETRGLALAQRQPKSAPALQELIDQVRARVIEHVLRDSRVSARLAGRRHRVVGADLVEEKSAAEDGAAPRLGEVGVYDYDRNVLVVARVDLRAGTVLDISERTGLQPPLSDEEVAEARRLVLDDPAYQALRQYPDLQVVALPARVAFSDRHARTGHRCFILTFWTGGDDPRKVGEAAVDLSTTELIAVAEAEAPDSPA